MRGEARPSGAPTRFGALVLAMVAAAVLPCAAAQALAAPSLAYRLEGDALAMIDPAALAVIDRIPLLPGARELAVSGDGRRAYALGWNYLQIVDLAARSVRAAVPVGGENARALHLAPDGQRLYLYERESYGDELALDVLDASAAGGSSARLPLPPGIWTAYVTGFATDAGGGRAWMVLAADGGSGRELWIDEIDLASGAVLGQVRSIDAGDAGFGQAAIVPARGVAFVSASRPSGSEVLEVELGTGAVLARVPLPAGALPFWDAARERLYAWTYAWRAVDEREHTALFALDPARGRAHRLAAFAGWPAAAALAPDGAFWMNLGEPAPRTVVVDAERGDVLGEIAATGGVGALAFAPALPDALPPTPRPLPTPAPPQSYRALVVSSDAHTVTEIDTGSAAAVRVRIEHALGDLAVIGTSADGARVYGVAGEALLRFDSESGEVLEQRIDDQVSYLRRGALAPDGSRAWVSGLQSLWEVDAASGSALGRVDLGGYDVQAIAFAPDGRRLLVATDHDWNDIDQGALHVIDPVTRRELWAVDFPGEGRDLAVSPDGRRAWIATGYAVVVVDLAAAAIAAVVPAPADAVALGPDGERAYVAGGGSWTGAPLSLTAIDGRSLRAAGAVAVADAGRVADLALTPDGQRALLAIDGAPARVAVVDLSRLETVGSVPVGARPRAVVIAAEPWTPPPTPTPRPHRPAGALRPCMLAPLAAGEQPPAGGIALLDPARHGVAATIQVGEPSAESQDLTLFDGVSAVAADPDGTLLYAAVPSHRGGAGYLAAVDPATGAVVDRLPLGIDPWSLSLTADGRRALVANYNGYLGHPSLSIVDLRAWRLVDEVPLPDGARGIYPSADGRLLFVRAQQRRYADGHDVYDDRLFAVDPLSGAVNFEIPLSTDRTPSGGIAVLPGGRALLADVDADAGYSEPEVVAVLDLESRAPVARIEIPFTSWGYRAYGSATFAVSPDGGEVYRGTGASPGTVAVIDPVARQLLAQIPVEHGFGPPAFTPDGAFVYGGSGLGGVAVIDTAARRLAAAIPLAASAGNIVAALIDAPCAAPPQPAATPTATSDPAPTGPTATPPPSPTPTWSGSWVDLRIGSASGRRGTTVAVDVRLDSAIAVAGTQIGIAYEPPLAIAATAGGQPACRVHAEAGKPSAFAFWPLGCGGAECRMVRALTLALDDVEPIAAGARLFTCDVVIAADAAPGAYPLRAVEVGASDAQGNALPARGHAGEVRVPTPAGGRLAARAGADARGCAIAPPAADRGAWLCAGLVLLLALRRRR